MSFFPKKERLSSTAFNRSFSTGKRAHSPALQLIYHLSDNFYGSVVVGKKVYKKAVTRNKVRRQLYAVLYRFQKSHQLKQTIIIVVKPSFKELTRNEGTMQLKELLGRTFGE